MTAATSVSSASDQGPAPARRPRGGLLRTRNYGLLWLGETTSAFGSAITTVALPLVAVVTLHASTAMVAMLTAATWLPWLLIGLPAGAWVDRWPRRRTLLVADTVSAAVMVGIPVAAWSHVLTMPLLLAAAIVIGSSGVFFALAFIAYLPHLVAKEDLLEGQARLQTSSSAAQFAGPGLGGVLAQVAGAVTGLLADSLTFLVSATCLLALRPEPEKPPEKRRRQSIHKQVGEGFSFILHEARIMRPLLCLATAESFVLLGIYSLRIVFLVRDEHVTPSTVGFVIGLGGIGGVVGSTFASRAVRRFGSARSYMLANLAMAPFIVLLPLGGRGVRLALFAAGTFVVSAGISMSNVISGTFRSSIVPSHLLGRVTACSRALVYGSMPLGATVGGFLGTVLGVHPALWVLAGLFAVTPLMLLLTRIPGMRDFPTSLEPGTRPQHDPTLE